MNIMIWIWIGGFLSIGAVILASCGTSETDSDNETTVTRDQVTEAITSKNAAIAQSNDLRNQLSSAIANLGPLTQERNRLEKDKSFLETDKVVLQESLNSLNQENTTLKQDTSILQSSLSSLEQERVSLREQLNSLLSGKFELESTNATLQNNLDSLTEEITQLRQHIKEAILRQQSAQQENQIAQDDLLVTQTSLTDLQSKFPPRQFPTLKILRAWLVEDNTSELPKGSIEGALNKALELQWRAARDGYLVGVNFGERIKEDEDITVWNTAVIGEKYYWWDPENPDDMVNFWLNVPSILF